MQCRKCGSKNLKVRKNSKNSSATDLYCGDCGAWIKFATKDEIRLFEAQEKTDCCENISKDINYFEKSPDTPKTNREWLNSLSNEQLANFLTENLQVKSYTGFVYCIGIGKIKYREISSVHAILHWLDSPQEFNICEQTWDH